MGTASWVAVGNSLSVLLCCVVVVGAAPVPCSNPVVNTTTGECGGQNHNYQSCEPGKCCSQYGYCGNTTTYCNAMSMCPAATAPPTISAPTFTSSLPAAPTPKSPNSRPSTPPRRRTSQTNPSPKPPPSPAPRTPPQSPTAPIAKRVTTHVAPLPSLPTAPPQRQQPASADAPPTWYAQTLWDVPVWIVVVTIVLTFVAIALVCKIEPCLRPQQQQVPTYPPTGRAAAIPINPSWAPVRSPVHLQFVPGASGGVQSRSMQYIRAGPHNVPQNQTAYF
ncbi:unnamed protein product (mitochondrion) [Plasmodiophora brassicae]|uniref:Chitin-binding type-1 domain-containing protein n=1 Tax=Plasmodiophora brassicae TaxID=37360 RepID=A0A3P3YFW0_PLABS|nr:unnamed protein product [Plasmodiophora brassicae]